MSKAKRGQAIGFMVKSPTNILAVSHGAWATQKAARASFTKYLADGDTWKKCYAAGWRVVPVVITERPKMSPRALTRSASGT